MFNHAGTVDTAIDGASNRDIAGDIVTGIVGDVALENFGSAGGNGGQRDTSRIHCLIAREFIPIDYLVGVRGIGEGDVHLTRLSGGKSGVLGHKDNDHALHKRLVAVILRIGGKDDLLPLIPLFEHVAARSNGSGPIALSIGVLRDYSKHREGEQQGVVRLVKMDFKDMVASCNGGIDHGQVRF